MTTVAVVGTGFMARTHLERFAEMEVNVVGVASQSRPDQFVTDHGLDATPYTDVEQMCHDLEPDFIDICTPTDTHRNFIDMAAEVGCDAFLEKPVAGSLREAQAIADAVADAEITCMVGHVLRFFPEYERAKSIVDNGQIGTHGVARARRLSPFPDWGTDDWYADRSRSGGVFVDLAIHDLDFLHWTFGDVTRVFARRQRRDQQEHGFVTLRFESGAVGYVEASWAQPASRELTSELELAGDDGLIELDSTEAVPFREFHDESNSMENTLTRDGYRRELDHFIECLSTETTPAVTVDDAISALRLSLAAQESAKRGQPVSPIEVQP
ncbi:Predicted dehydrogenase [Halogranum amylolyticum]|uniref:Predicted dehydrogenase n=1 Tax=Halogranum amylolyticum TaxID=660520 RepID=A0A1H8UHK5_9EURY|nr:Gfo/Idh/MocA family oxidoreductase [Halogranum amylolyticum]SEP02699.1 Predicted dehydrogenase [Halogranum amylolyticum]